MVPSLEERGFLIPKTLGPKPKRKEDRTLGEVEPGQILSMGRSSLMSLLEVPSWEQCIDGDQLVF